MPEYIVRLSNGRTFRLEAANRDEAIKKARADMKWRQNIYSESSPIRKGMNVKDVRPAHPTDREREL